MDQEYWISCAKWRALMAAQLLYPSQKAAKGFTPSNQIKENIYADAKHGGI
jgi:hypothetical protein